MDYLEELNRMGYMYMFQYTITPYDNTLEKNISDKSDIIKNVLELSEKSKKNESYGDMILFYLMILIL